MNWFKELGIANKILIAVLLLIFSGAVIIMCFTGYREVLQVRESAVHEARAIVLQAESARNMVADMNEQGAFSAYVESVKQDLRNGVPGALEKFLVTVPVLGAIRILQDNAADGGYLLRVPKIEPRNPANEPDPLEREVLQELKNTGAREKIVYSDYVDPATGKKSEALRYFRPIVLSKSCEICHGDPSTSSELWGNSRGLDPSGGRMEGWRAGEVHGAFELIYFLDESMAAMKKSQMIMAACIVFGMFVIVVLVGFITRNLLSKPLSDIIKHAEYIAQGDFSRSFEQKYSGEMGQLARAFDAMKKGLVKLLVGVRDESGNLSRSAVRLLDISKGLSEQSVFAEERAREAASVSQDASNNINSIASAVEDFSVASQEIASNVANAASISNTARSRMEEASAQVLKLGENSNDIGTAVRLISEIAEQTNLLALNATIEAARAGEAGKGFAVVANEVKELAKQTAQAAEEITSMIQVVQNDTSRTVTSIGDVTAIIEQLNDIDNTIASAVEEQTATVNEITANIAGAAEGTEHVSQTVGQVAEVSGESSENALVTKTQAEELAELAQRLQELVASFKV
jgi:methyl-accepting chemotaxis protein